MGTGNLTKFIMGIVIFMFGTALAYFTARYVDNQDIFDYWLTLALFGALYVLIGAVVNFVFPVSLGFLFSADVLILHVLAEKYEAVNELYKLALLGVVLVILYFFTWWRVKDNSAPTSPQG